MEKIIDNKNGTYSFQRDGKILHTGKWGDKYVAPKVIKGPVAPVQEPVIKSPLLPTNNITTPKVNLFDFSSLNPVSKLQTPQAPAIPFTNTGPVAPQPIIKSPLLPTETPMDTFTSGLPKTQPQPQNNGIFGIPKASASADKFYLNDKELKELIDQGATNDEIIKINEQVAIDRGLINTKPQEVQQEVKKEQPGFLGIVGQELSGIGEKTASTFKGGLERLGEGQKKVGNANSPMDYLEGISQGVAGTFQTAFSPIAGIVGQGIEPYLGLTGKAYKGLVPDDIQKSIASGTVEGINTAKSWYDMQDEPTKQKLRTAGYLAEIGLEFVGAKPAKEVGKNLLKGGEKVLEGVAGVGKPIIKGTGKVINKTGEGITATTEYGTKLVTGLNRDTQQVIKNNIKTFQAVKKGEISAENITGDLKTNISKRITNLSETGKGYQELKKSNITFPKQEIQGLYNNRLTQEGLSKELIELPLEDRNAIKQAQFYLNEIPNNNLTTKEAIELKAKLRSLVSYDKGVSPEGERIVKGLIKDLDNNLKTKIPGFKELDEIYGPEREFLNKVQKDLFNKDGTLKDSAISTIRNLTGKGKENKLDRLEKIMPGIGEKVKAIKAYEDLQNAIEGKTGSYARGALLGGSLYTGGPIGGIITFAITHPSVASKALEIYGLSKSKISNLLNKFKSKIPLDNLEKKQIQEAIKTPANKVLNETFLQLPPPSGKPTVRPQTIQGAKGKPEKTGPTVINVTPKTAVNTTSDITPKSIIINPQTNTTKTKPQANKPKKIK